MKRNKITWSELCDIIDNHVDDAQDFTLLCDKSLTTKILDYWEDCEFEQEHITINNSDEYIVSIYCYKDEIDFDVEPLRGNNGEIKGHETNDLFIFINVDEDEVEAKIECECLSYCELVEDEESDKDECDCEDESECDCLDCTLDRYVSMIQEVSPCPDCIKKILLSFIGEVIEHIEFEDAEDDEDEE